MAIRILLAINLLTPPDKVLSRPPKAFTLIIEMPHGNPDIVGNKSINASRLSVLRNRRGLCLIYTARKTASASARTAGSSYAGNLT